MYIYIYLIIKYYLNIKINYIADLIGLDVYTEENEYSGEKLY